jgi:serine/threonine-protein kinase
MDNARLRDLQVRLRAIVAGQFEVRELLGSGGFAAVFRAKDTLLGRDVAIKVLDPSLALDASAANRLLDEARLVASIEHAHIVPLYEAGHQDGIVYLVMRYYPDGTARARLERTGRWSPGQVVQLGIEAAEALAAAHARGVVHLDIKPDNILLDSNGHAAVADFGIARVLAASGAAQPGMVSGTPHYMSPEQVAGDQLDGRADVYALGVVLYQLATGQRPVRGDSDREVMANQVRQVPKPLSEIVPDMPAPLARAITKALAKEPAERWAGAQEMADALRAAAAPDQLLSPAQARKRVRRRWYFRGAMVGCGLLAGLVLFGYIVVRLISTFGKGDPPAIDALSPLIPPVLVDSARAMGALTDRDTLLYVFAPHSHGLADAFFVTNRDMVAVKGGVIKRYAIADDYDLDLRLTPGHGYLLVNLPARQLADTVYSTLSGLELQVMTLSLKRVFALLRK